MIGDPVIYLLRHGETVFNAERRYQGQLDSPLTDRGVTQARAVAEVLAEHLNGAHMRIVSSPLGRALRTAEILADAVPETAQPEIDDRLTEVGMGTWDGLTRAQIAKRWPDARRGRSIREWMFHGPGGESMEDLCHRLSAALADLRNPSGRVPVVVSHAVAGRIIRSLHAGIPPLKALKLDAPQDAIFVLLPGGEIEMLTTNEYRQRHA